MKWFSREKGWGFIRLANGDEVFVHHSDIEGEGYVSLDDGEEVEFSVEPMEKGPRAREVRSAGEPAPERREPAEPARAAAGSSDAGVESGRSGSSDSPDAAGEGGPLPLAEQLRRRLAGRFPGLGV